MNEQKLIEQLATDLKPTSLWTRPARLLGVWILCAALWSTLCITCVTQSAEAPYAVLQNIGIAVLSAVIAYAAFISGIPGRAIPKYFWIFGSLFLILLMGSLAFEAWKESKVLGFVPGLEMTGMACSRAMLWMSAVPIVVFFLLMRTQAPVNPKMTGVLLGAASALSAAFILGMHCSVAQPAHVLLWHWLPSVVVAGLAAFCARRLFSW